MSDTYSINIPTVVTAAGLQPTPPATLQLLLIQGVAATNLDYTTNLPGILIEDISSTEVAGLSLIDQAKVELVNSLDPYSANDWLLIQLGNMAGISQAPATNTSVYVVFSGTPGFVVVKGFVVSDGVYQYVVQDGGIIGTGGASLPLYCVATQTGSWAVPSGTVTQAATAVPAGITCTPNNPTAGTPGGAAQSSASFRQAVLQANLAVSQGMTTALKTSLAMVPGVQARLVSVQQQTAGGWEVIVGGGDPNFVGYAIFAALFDISSLVGSVLNVVSIGNSYPAVITTDKDHGYATGQVVTIKGAEGSGNIPSINNTPFTVTVTGETTFTIAFTPSGSYTGGGVVTPNLRNITASINDYPDTYEVIFVNPPALTVAMTVTWNTISTNFVSPASVAQLASAALADYVNNVVVGQPLNILEMEQVFLESVASILPANLVSLLTISVSVNGIGVSPVGALIYGEPSSAVQEGYFTTNSGMITVTQS
jgi:hypothetical protein